jgi:hypothetical protein
MNARSEGAQSLRAVVDGTSIAYWPPLSPFVHQPPFPPAEIIMLEQNVALYRMSNETRFFIIGSALVRSNVVWI